MAVVLPKSLPLLGPRDAGLPMSLDEFEAADYRAGHRYELIHGVLVVTPSPLEEERDSNEELGHMLRVYRETHPQGASLDLTLPEQTLRTIGQIRRCDRAVWTGLGRLPITRGPAARRDVPALVIEFPSSREADRRRDYVEKRIEYRDLGVQEYWIIDRFQRTMTVYSWRGGRWSKRSIGAADAYRTPLLPGFDLPLKKLFAVSDKYRDLPAEEE